MSDSILPLASRLLLQEPLGLDQETEYDEIPNVA